MLELVKVILEGIHDQQQLVNPYEPGGELYYEFMGGYYAGYLVYLVAETVVTGGATRLVSESGQFATVVRHLESGGLAAYRAVGQTGQILRVQAAVPMLVFAQATNAVTEVAPRLVGQSRSAGKGAENTRTARQSGVDEADLSPQQAEQIGQRVNQPSTGQVIEEMPPDLYRQVLANGASPQEFSRASSTYRQLDPDTRALVWPAVMAGKISFKQLADWSAEEAKRELENGDDDDEEDDELEIHHIDVGQADSTLIITPEGETILIGTGDHHKNGSEVISYIESLDKEIDRIDHLVGTHPHADHIGGHDAVIEHFETERDGIGTTYDLGIDPGSDTYEDFIDAVHEYDVDLKFPEEGDELPLEDDEVSALVLNPPEDHSGEDLHYNSMTIVFEYSDFRYLTTGDAESAAEQRMAADWSLELDADVYRAGHHGSNTSSTSVFLDQVAPEIAVISSGYRNKYQHPNDDVLEEFADRSLEVYWTGVHNDTVVKTDGDEIVVVPARAFSSDPKDILETKPDYGASARSVVSRPNIVVEPRVSG